MKEIIKVFQKDLIKIYRSGLKEKPLYLLAEDNCSEASRLIAIWIKKKFNEANLFILKGEYVPKKYHDLLVCQFNGRFYLIDASVWQFFKKKRNILMGEFKNMDEVFIEVKKIYGGKWGNVETLNNFEEEKELIEIIKININL